MARNGQTTTAAATARPSPTSLAAHLAQVRRRLFVGRESAKAHFMQLINPNSGVHVLFLYAAGGMGKTTVLREFAHLSVTQELPVLALDARAIANRPDALQQAVAAARKANGVTQADPQLLLLDTFELLSVLEGWLREQWLPAQPDCVRVVLAGRMPPSVAWRTDPAWATSLCHHELLYLQDDEAREYLLRRKLPAAAIQCGSHFARGHPLALALYADAVTAGDVAVTSTEALLPELTACLLGNIENVDQRHALYACAMVRSLTEPQLAAILDRPEATDLFNWLRSVSFIEASSGGLFPHDLIRETLLADLKQRDLGLYQRYGERAYNWLIERIDKAEGNLMELGMDAFYLLRDMQLPWHMADMEQEQFYLDKAIASDWPAIDAMVLKHEGPQGLTALHTLTQAQPEALHVVRDGSQAVIGMFLLLALQRLPQAVIEQDPPCAAFWARCQAGGLAKPRANLLRFWMHRERYMDLSSILPQVQAYTTLDAITSGMQFTGSRRLDNDVWRYITELIGNKRLEGSECDTPGGPTVLNYQDYSNSSALDWLRSIYRRVQGMLEPKEVAARPAEPPLQQADYDQAVRAALKQFHRPDRLADNPLLGSHLVLHRADSDDAHSRQQALRAILKESCEDLAANPKTAAFARALRHAYITPAASQELAAEAACMAYGTFRRNLREATKLLCARLWMDEQQSS